MKNKIKDFVALDLRWNYSLWHQFDISLLSFCCYYRSIYYMHPQFTLYNNLYWGFQIVWVKNVCQLRLWFLLSARQNTCVWHKTKIYPLVSQKTKWLVVLGKLTLSINICTHHLPALTDLSTCANFFSDSQNLS